MRAVVGVCVGVRLLRQEERKTSWAWWEVVVSLWAMYLLILLFLLLVGVLSVLTLIKHVFFILTDACGGGLWKICGLK